MTIATLGYRHHRPNAPQRLNRWIARTRPGAWFLARMLRRLDRVLLRVTRRRTSLTALVAGLPVITLTTIGARTGREHATCVLGIPLGERLAVAGVDFGSPRVPSWAYNLAVHPEARVGFAEQMVPVIAHAASDSERAEALACATAVYPPFATYVERIGARPMPVFVLEAMTDRPGLTERDP